MTRLTFANLTKVYGKAPALQDVTLTLTGGRVHALMGENGAGKSTLIKLIAGVVPADRMSVTRGGKPVALSGPQVAHAAGFRFIHQELNIVPQVSVAENILIGRDYPRRLGLFLDWPRVRATARAALERLGATHIDVDEMAGALPAGDKMLIKIAAALVDEERPSLTVLDEPTAALTGEESQMLFRVIERLAAEGTAILYVSHRMDEVLSICDDVTVLRDGRHVMTRAVDETNKAEIIEAMTGRDVADSYPPRTGALGERVLASLEGVSSARLRDLSFELRCGEILGVAGLADAGQSEVLRLFMGLETVRSGSARYDEGPLPHSPAEAWARHVAYIPRERRSQSLMLQMAIRANVVLPHLGRWGAFASGRGERRQTRQMAERVRLKCEGPDQPAAQLSGGNQQKVVFARALCGTPRLLLLDEPTRGVDVGAKYDIYTLVRALSANGCAVILTSSDLPELLGMCERILVLHEGRQAHLVPREGLTSADLLSLYYRAEEAAA